MACWQWLIALRLNVADLLRRGTLSGRLVYIFMVIVVIRVGYIFKFL